MLGAPELTYLIDRSLHRVLANGGGIPTLLTTFFAPKNDGPFPMSKKPKRKLTAAEKRARRERKKNFMTIFINGKQKRVPRPKLIEGLPVHEFIARNADPIWLHQNGMREYIMPEDDG